MCKEFGALMFTVVVGLAAPASATPTTVDEAQQTATTSVAVQRVSIPSTGVRDEAAMVLVGTALIGLAAAVRRAA